MASSESMLRQISAQVQAGDLTYIASNGAVAFLQLESRMTVAVYLIGTLKFLSQAQGLCPYSPDPFSLLEGGVWARD